jgi:glycosyltransferase involved in cell wall biosynthesis
MLWKLLSRIDRVRFDPFVVVLNMNVNPAFRQRFDSIGIDCHFVKIRARREAISGFLRLKKLLLRLRPDLIQGWLYHGNVAATLIAALLRQRVPVIWNIRGTLPADEKKLSSFVVWLSGKLSSSPVRIINNSAASALEHEQRLGYPASTRVIIANGFETGLYIPADDARRRVRSSLGLPTDAILIGLFGRYHPMKDHANFIRAAALVNRDFPDVHYVLAGEHVDAGNASLTELVALHGLTRHVSLLGLRDDMEILTAAVDIAVSSSAYGEGFANVVGEAMSCGVPCVVTDVGDSAAIVGDTGCVVQPRDPQALAHALSALLEQAAAVRQTLGARARQRVIDLFALDTIVRRYEELYVQVHSELSARAYK